MSRQSRFSMQSMTSCAFTRGAGFAMSSCLWIADAVAVSVFSFVVRVTRMIQYNKRKDTAAAAA